MAMSRGRKVAVVIVGVVLALVLVAVLAVAYLVASMDNEPSIRDNSVLVLKVEGDLPDFTNVDPVASRLFGGNPNSLTSLLTQLKKAKAGKPISAYMEVGADKELYVASAAERVYVAPTGDLFVNGLAAEAMYFRGSFDKLGIYWDSYQIGRY